MPGDIVLEPDLIINLIWRLPDSSLVLPFQGSLRLYAAAHLGDCVFWAVALALVAVAASGGSPVAAAGRFGLDGIGGPISEPSRRALLYKSLCAR